MNPSTCSRRRAATLLLATLAVPAGWAEAADAAASAPSLQDLRNQRVLARKQRVFYTGKTFDVESLPRYAPQQKVSGTIRISGLNYLGDSMLKDYWEQGFRKFHPDIRFEFDLKTALTSTSALVTGTADIGANRKMTFTEYLQFQRVFDRDPLEIPLATGSLDVPGWSDAMTVFVHKDNPLKGLTLKQLDGIFGTARRGGWEGTTWHPEYARGLDQNLRTWGQLGLGGEWAKQGITPYMPVVRYDTTTKFSDAVLHGSDQWNERAQMFANSIDEKGEMVSWAQGIMGSLAKDRFGIAFGSHAYANADIKTLPIQFEEGGPFVEPTLENIQSRAFKLFQANYWYVNRAPGQPLDPKVKEFLLYTLSQDGQKEVIRDGKYTPVNAKLAAAARQSLE